MPYYMQPGLETPDHLASKAWRYMSLAKFLSMLETKSLFFSSLRHIRETIDSHEGELTQADWEFLTIGGNKESARETQQMFRYFANWLYVNCWHVNEHESISMWERYLPDCDGLAIRSDFYRMRECLKDVPGPVRIGMVQYEDFTTYTTYAQWALMYAVLKRQEYQDEREIRMIYMPDVGLTGNADLAQLEEASNRLESQKGYQIPVNLEGLIEQIVVSPSSQGWLVDLVKNCVERANLDPDIVIHSQLNRPPTYD